jgi:hypothetical protein
MVLISVQVSAMHKLTFMVAQSNILRVTPGSEKQDRQCTPNVTLSLAHITIIAVENQ